MRKFEELEERHPLNANLEIPFMEAKGAYHIIADICDLEYVGEGIFINTNTGMKYILTKFGFENSIQYSYQVKYAQTIMELRKLKSDYAVLDKNSKRFREGQIKALNEQIESYRKKIKNQATAVNQHREKIDIQSEEIKNKDKKIRELYSVLKKHNIRL